MEAHSLLILAAAATLIDHVAEGTLSAAPSVLLLPYYHRDSAPVFRLPSTGFLGHPLDSTTDPLACATNLAACLTIAIEPMLYNVQNGGRSNASWVL